MYQVFNLGALRRCTPNTKDQFIALAAILFIMVRQISPLSRRIPCLLVGSSLGKNEGRGGVSLQPTAPGSPWMQEKDLWEKLELVSLQTILSFEVLEIFGNLLPPFHAPPGISRGKVRFSEINIFLDFLGNFPKTFLQYLFCPPAHGDENGDRNHYRRS